MRTAVCDSAVEHAECVTEPETRACQFMHKDPWVALLLGGRVLSVNSHLWKLLLCAHQALPVVESKFGNMSTMNTDGLSEKLL